MFQISFAARAQLAFFISLISDLTANIDASLSVDPANECIAGLAQFCHSNLTEISSSSILDRSAVNISTDATAFDPTFSSLDCALLETFGVGSGMMNRNCLHAINSQYIQQGTSLFVCSKAWTLIYVRILLVVCN